MRAARFKKVKIKKSLNDLTANLFLILFISNLYLGKLTVTDKLIMTINGKKTWFFHGDIFDISMKHAKWLAKLGGKGYDMLIVLNKTLNNISLMLGYKRISLSKQIKDSVKKAVSFISNFLSIFIRLS